MHCHIILILLFPPSVSEQKNRSGVKRRAHSEEIYPDTNLGSCGRGKFTPPLGPAVSSSYQIVDIRRTDTKKNRSEVMTYKLIETDTMSTQILLLTVGKDGIKKHVPTR
ncbi:hypothetical protein EXN66_Car006577 [Channa argus]|uniref:Secreted protein n=1 Tax=Channa argus TaxID=215402 RepID=A0A6G1PL37_CHAAH|nr:hypothetical protein EXN66_Car006577 [Channa argus]